MKNLTVDGFLLSLSLMKSPKFEEGKKGWKEKTSKVLINPIRFFSHKKYWRTKAAIIVSHLSVNSVVYHTEDTVGL